MLYTSNCDFLVTVKSFMCFYEPYYCDCLLSSECCQNVGDLHSILAPKASRVATDRTEAAAAALLT